MNVTNPIYETAKTSDKEGDYVDMEDIDTEEEPQHKYEYISVVQWTPELIFVCVV